MGKRSLKSMPTDPGEADVQDAADHNTSTAVDKEESIAPDDISNIPPPPPAKIKANQDSARKVSPSKVLLDRYKTRSASSGSPPTIKIPTSSPRDNADSPSPKGTTFRSDLEHYTPITNTDSANNGNGKARADSGSPNSDRQVRFIVPTESNLGLEMKQARNNENTSPARREETLEEKPRRTTRSIARRQERMDSQHRESIDNIIAKDFAKDFANVSLSPTEMPPALTIRKAEASQSPSPRPPKPSHGQAEQYKGPPPPPEEPSSPPEPKTPQPEEPNERPSTPPVEDPPEIPPKSPRRSESNSPHRSEPSSPRSEPNSPRRVDFLAWQKKKKKTAVPERSTEQNGEVPDPGPKDSPVAVRPPIYDPNKTPGQQWESDYGSTSRPTSPWLHSKRWTCCQCQALTIVEQTVCSKVLCAHDRCPSSCRVERQDRVRGPFQRY